jgi:hypothetical protein
MARILQAWTRLERSGGLAGAEEIRRRGCAGVDLRRTSGGSTCERRGDRERCVRVQVSRRLTPTVVMLCEQASVVNLVLDGGTSAGDCVYLGALGCRSWLSRAANSWTYTSMSTAQDASWHSVETHRRLRERRRSDVAKVSVQPTMDDVLDRLWMAVVGAVGGLNAD